MSIVFLGMRVLEKGQSKNALRMHQINKALVNFFIIAGKKPNVLCYVIHKCTLTINY